MRWFKFAVYSTDLAMLRDYLKHGLDPYDFRHYLDEYFEETGGYPQGYVDADQYMDIMTEEELAPFKEWLEKTGKHYEDAADANSPSYLHMDFNEIVPPDTWLVHFSDAVAEIEGEGFQKGHWDMGTLGLTTHFDPKTKEPGWNFAFVADSKDADWAAYKGKYGKDAFMFMGAGAEVYHSGDEENQVIFQGQGIQSGVPLYKYDGEWLVSSNRDGRELYRGEFKDVVAWVQQNYNQYRDVITSEFKQPK